MNHPCEPIRYDERGTHHPQTGLDPADLAALAPRLATARDEVLADVALWNAGAAVAAEKQPLDAAFIELPEKLLADFHRDASSSELGRLRAVADRLAGEVDRVVVLGIGGSYMGARALFEACCHPYHNELPRAARGDRPRLYFEGNNVDNDALRGLLDLVGGAHSGAEGGAGQGGPGGDWALVVVSKSGATLETAIAFRRFLAELEQSCAGQAARLARRVVPVTGPSGRLRDLSAALGCEDVFPIPDGVGGRFSILSAVGLLPAAILGLDVRALLAGAAAMNERFRTAPVEENPVLRFVGVCHLLEQRRGLSIRVLSAWSKGLEALGLWYDQLLAESLGKHERGATPLTVVNTRDLHSRGQQHQEGRRDKLITNLIVDHPRRPPLAIGSSVRDEDRLNELADKTLPEVMSAAIAGTNQAYAEDGRPTANLYLPRLDEATLGQVFQMLMLATVVEGRLVGTNPYGQPGVEGYKKHMNRLLRES